MSPPVHKSGIRNFKSKLSQDALLGGELETLTFFTHRQVQCVGGGVREGLQPLVTWRLIAHRLHWRPSSFSIPFKPPRSPVSLQRLTQYHRMEKVSGSRAELCAYHRCGATTKWEPHFLQGFEQLDFPLVISGYAFFLFMALSRSPARSAAPPSLTQLKPRQGNVSLM